LFYSTQDKISLASALSKYTVVLTTYGTMAMEAPMRARQGAKGAGKKAGTPAGKLGRAGEGIGVDVYQRDREVHLAE
jgi:hypothetical protein